MKAGQIPTVEAGAGSAVTVQPPAPGSAPVTVPPPAPPAAKDVTPPTVESAVKITQTEPTFPINAPSDVTIGAPEAKQPETPAQSWNKDWTTFGAVKPEEQKEIDKILTDPSKASRELVNEVYTRGARRRALLKAEIDQIDLGLAKLLDIALVKEQKRRECFGQFDASAAICTQTCRDPVCPDYTAKFHEERMKSLQQERDDSLANLGESRPAPESILVDLNSPDPIKVFG